MKNWLQNLRDRKKTIAAVAIAAALFFASGFYLGYKDQPAEVKVSDLTGKNSPLESSADFAPFWKAWTILNDKFVNSASTTGQAKVWGAIEGLASSYGDPYTVFFPPAQSKIFEGDITGNFSGVGMEIGIRGGVLTVISPIKGSPAEKAGVKSGDIVLKIDNKSASEMAVDEAVGMIRGEKGTDVSITFAREGVKEPIVKKITRDVIDIPTIDTSLRPDGVFVIKLYNFSAVSPDLFRKALREFIISGSDKLVLDLRGNPGGYLDAAIDMASWFLPPGKVVVREKFGGDKPEEIYRSKGYGNGKYGIFNENLKMAVLVDGGSASASEILSGALKEQKVATIVGTNTFGKGSVQELVSLTSDTSLKVTIAKWLTPEGKSISDGGLAPNVEVKMTEKDAQNGKDPQLDKAVQILLNMGK